MPPSQRGSGRSAVDNRSTIEAFLQSCRQPALLEPGEELLPLTGDNLTIEVRGERLTIQAWDRTRNLTRRVASLEDASAGRLELAVERFAKRRGQLFLLDLARRPGAEMGRRSGRLVFRERLRLFLRRQFPDWTLKEITAEANLEFSLSPAYPRAFLRHGQHAWAAIACPPEGDAAGVVTFGLIWLAHLRERERRVAVEGLAIYVPTGRERTAALRVLCLDPAAARFELFAYAEDDTIERVDPGDHGNLDTRLYPYERPLAPEADRWERLGALPGVERIEKHDGRTSLRVRGLEFAEISGADLVFGIASRQAASPYHVPEIERLAEELERARSAGGDRGNPLYAQFPEAWLESQVRAHIEAVDASLLPHPVYGQVPAFAGGERGVLDLLACDHHGRLAVVELKAAADLHLPLQSLDYWLRVKWHTDRGDFGANGYFPGVELTKEPPRVLLISPSLEFHPTTETLLSFFSPAIDVTRIGLGVEWRRELHVMFRLTGAQRPQ